MVQSSERVPFIDDFYCEARDNGDYLRAFNEAQDALPEVGNFNSLERSATLAFRPVLYKFSDTLHIRRPMHLMGAGAFYNNGTMLEFSQGKKGVIIHGKNTCKYAEFGGNASMQHSFAQGSIIERMLIVASGAVPTEPVTKFNESYVTPFEGPHGLTVYAKCHVRDVTILGFSGHGIYMFGFKNNPVSSLATDTDTNVAMSQFSNVSVHTCGGDGLHIIGSDASHMLFTGCTFNGCGSFGICDKSYLGCNTFITGQASENAIGPAQRPREVTASDYQTLARRLRYDINLDPTNALNNGYAAIEAALIDMGNAAIDNMLFVDPVLFPGIKKFKTPEYIFDYLAYVIAKYIKRKKIIALLYAAARPFGDPSYFKSSIELEHTSVYALGSNVFLNFYDEGGNTWREHFDQAFEKACLVATGQPSSSLGSNTLADEIKVHLGVSRANIAVGSPPLADAGASGLDTNNSDMVFYNTTFTSISTPR